MVNSDEVLLRFGSNVRTARKEKGLSQEKLALDADFDRTYIGLIERGKRNPSLMTIYRIADVLDVAPEVLLRRK